MVPISSYLKYLCFIFKYLYFTLKYKYFKCLGAEIWNIFQKDLGPQFYFLPLTYFYHPWAHYQTHPKSIPHPSTLPISQPTQTHCGKPCAACCGISSRNQTQLMPLWNSWGEWLLCRRVTYNTYGATLCEIQIHWANQVRKCRGKAEKRTGSQVGHCRGGFLEKVSISSRLVGRKSHRLVGGMGEGISKRGETFLSLDEQVLLWRRLGCRLARPQPEALSRGALAEAEVQPPWHISGLHFQMSHQWSMAL